MLAHSFSVTVTTTATKLTSLATTAGVTITGDKRYDIRLFNHTGAAAGTAIVGVGTAATATVTGDVDNNGEPLAGGVSAVYPNQEPDGLFLVVGTGTQVIHVSLFNERT